MKTDTDGILDRCGECEARANERYERIYKYHWIQCSECANSSESFDTKQDAQINWNKQQRKITNNKENN